MSTNCDLLIRDTLGDPAADVYKTQCAINESFSHDYHMAYAYGPESEPQAIHEKVAVLGAASLGMDTADYLELWDEAVEVINTFNDLPAEFQDEKYLIND